MSPIVLPRDRSVGAGAWAGTRFVLGADRGLVQLWNVMNGKAEAGPVLHGLSSKAQVRSVAAAVGGQVVAAVDAFFGPAKPGQQFGPSEGELAVWRGGRLVGGKPLNLHNFGDVVALSPDGSTAAVSADTSERRPVQVLIVDTSTGNIERHITVPNASGSVTALAFAADGTLATGSWSGIVDLWNPKTGQPIGHRTLVAPAPVASIAFSPDGTTFATSGGSSGGTSIWGTATGQQLGSNFPGGDGQWGSVAYTPDDRYLISVFGDDTAYRWPATLDAWARQACRVAGERSFTRDEWRRLVGSRSYSKVCS
jgi:WD40 repeat protein